jgi:hypothetical protein
MVLTKQQTSNRIVPQYLAALRKKAIQHIETLSNALIFAVTLHTIESQCSSHGWSVSLGSAFCSTTTTASPHTANLRVSRPIRVVVATRVGSFGGGFGDGSSIHGHLQSCPQRRYFTIATANLFSLSHDFFGQALDLLCVLGRIVATLGRGGIANHGILSRFSHSGSQFRDLLRQLGSLAIVMQLSRLRDSRFFSPFSGHLAQFILQRRGLLSLLFELRSQGFHFTQQQRSLSLRRLVSRCLIAGRKKMVVALLIHTARRFAAFRNKRSSQLCDCPFEFGFPGLPLTDLSGMPGQGFVETGLGFAFARHGIVRRDRQRLQATAQRFLLGLQRGNLREQRRLFVGQRGALVQCHLLALDRILQFLVPVATLLLSLLLHDL